MASIVDDVRSPLRRPCLIRMKNEADIDRQTDRRGSPRPYNGYPFTFVSGGSGAIDERALTIDRQPGMSPRCVGLRKGRVNSPVEHMQPAKSDSVRTLQAWGMGNNSDLNLIQTKRLCSPTPMHRLKFEALQGMPLSGRGADISLAGGRRIQGLEMRNREASPQEAKRGLLEISIEHQFRRRHQSCPPKSGECKFKDDFEHTLRAEEYAHILGRPEGTMRPASKRKGLRALSARPWRPNYSNERSLSPKYSPRIRPNQEVHHELPCKDGQHIKTSDEGSGSDVDASHAIRPQVPPLPMHSAQLLSTLREATKNMPTEAVWDAMMSVLAESPQLSPQLSPKAASRGPLDDPSLPTRVATAVAVGASAKGRFPSPRQRTRNFVPAKKRSGPFREDPQICSKDGHRHSSPRRMSRQASETSVMSATTADTLPGRSSLPGAKDGSGGQSGSQSHTSSSTSLRSSESNMRSGSRRSGSATDWLHDQQWKARRRAQWVA